MRFTLSVRLTRCLWTFSRQQCISLRLRQVSVITVVCLMLVVAHNLVVDKE